HSQQLVGEDHRSRLAELGGRAASQSNVYLDSMGYRDNGFDTFSVDSSDSMETSISACSPDNVSRDPRCSSPPPSLNPETEGLGLHRNSEETDLGNFFSQFKCNQEQSLELPVCVQHVFVCRCVFSRIRWSVDMDLVLIRERRASTSNVAKIEEMERLLREAQAEKHRLLEYREREMEVRHQALEEERRRREELEKRLQEETSRRQKLIEREVKLREKQRAQ
ncbi:pleckstrin homology-like domain family B member 1 isoform X1, partial [Tachysurus ichikawai]